MSNGNELVEFFVDTSITPEPFFQFLPIEMDFFFCLLVKDIADDVIENTEEIDFSVMARNENDVFEDSSTASLDFTVLILDNDGL